MRQRTPRFGAATREIAGTAELQIVNRGHHSEIDVFPGEPLNNKLATTIGYAQLLAEDPSLPEDLRLAASEAHRVVLTGCSVRESNRSGLRRRYPAIDLLNGRCVRLRQGDYSRETVFSDDPASVARNWVALGADRVCDLGAHRAAENSLLGFGSELRDARRIRSTG